MTKQKLFKHLNKIIPFVEIFSKAISFLGVIIITRLLTVEEFGIYYFIISLVAWASVFMDGGVSYFIINKSVKDEMENLGDYFSSRVYFSIITILILSVAVSFYKLSYITYVILYSLSFLCILLTAFFKIIARIQNKVILDITTILLEPVFRVLILGVVFYLTTNTSLKYIFWTLFATSFSSFYVSLKYFKKLIPIKIKHLISPSEMLSTLKETKSFLFMYLFLVGLKRVEIIIINFKFDTYNTGLYSSADNFYNSAYLFFTALILVLLKTHYKDDLKKKFRNIITLFGLSVFSVLFFLFFSDFIYSFFYGTEYQKGHELLRIICYSLLFTPFIYLFILSNNYNNRTNRNVLILFIMFSLKTILLLMTKTIEVFCYVVVLIDFFTLILFFLLSRAKKFVKTTI